MRALNARLPSDVRVTRAVRARPVFDARRDAMWRRYRYTVRMSEYPDVFADEFAWRMRGIPCVACMQSAASALVSPTAVDLSALRKAHAQARHTSIRVLAADVVAAPDGVFHIDITATWFVYGMMRFLAAAIVEVGLGRLAVDKFVQHVHSRDRAAFKNSAPAAGLCLMEVGYLAQMDPFCVQSETVEYSGFAGMKLKARSGADNIWT